MQAEAMVTKRKAVLVDARSPWQFEKEHCTGAINLPLFVDVAGTSFWDNAKKLIVRIGMNMRATGVLCHVFVVAEVGLCPASGVCGTTSSCIRSRH